MKNLKGGLVSPPPGATWGQCSGTATCQNGTTVTQECEGWNVQCAANDYGSPNGYPGGINNGSVTCSKGLVGYQSLSQVVCPLY